MVIFWWMIVTSPPSLIHRSSNACVVWNRLPFALSIRVLVMTGLFIH